MKETKNNCMRHFEPTTEQEQLWDEWLNDRPALVKEVAEKFPPWNLYKIKKTGNIVYVYGFYENDNDEVTLLVSVEGRFNKNVIIDRHVFGYKPEDLDKVE